MRRKSIGHVVPPAPASRLPGVAVAVAIIVGAGGVPVQGAQRAEGEVESASRRYGAAELGAAPDPGLWSSLRYRMVGPSRGGRVTAVAGHRATPGVFYAGSTGGGVWKTSDYGSSWLPISDGFFATGSIGAIRVADSDSQIVVVGTGSDGLRSNVIIGKGVYKSIDAGKSWRHVGLEAVGNIGAVLIHPTDPDRLWVAAIGNPFAPNPERGVYRSTDGGASWAKVLFVSAQTGAVDLEFAPDNPDEIYATMWRAERKPWTIISGGTEGGVYKSADGGATWVQLTNGLPGGLRGKADLAVSAADPDRVYVLMEAPGSEGGVYRSDDRGASWRQVTDFQPIRNRAFYYTNLEAHPGDPDILWGMAEGFWKSEDGGETWNSSRVPHGDNHDMWINPDDPDLFVQSNDGGANVTRDGGSTWSTQHNQPTAELYQVDVSDEFPYRLYAGQQDNTTISVPSMALSGRPGGHSAYWEEHGGCETGPAVPKPGDPDIVYANCKGRFGVYDRRTGQEQQYYVGFWNLYGRNPKDLPYRFQRVAPVHVSPHSSTRVYHGSQYVHVTDDGGKTWRQISPDLTEFAPETQVASGEPITRDVTGEEHFSVLYDIQESPHEPGVIWAGANDGPVHVTRNGGVDWTNVTPPDIERFGRVQTIEVSPHNVATAFVSILRYQLGDFRPYAFRTDDYGASWTLLTPGTNGIPDDHPVHVVREDPDRAGLLYAGTEFGVFLSFDNGSNWQSLQLNLPVTPITDMKVVHRDLVLSTMGRGFWILDNLTPLHEATADLATRAVHLFEARPALRIRGGGFGGSREPAPHEPEYAPLGATVDYYLAAEAEGRIELEIFDPRGRLVRAFSSDVADSDAESVVEPAEPGMRGPRLESLGTPRLPSAAGMNRFVWDLRYAGAWDADERRAGRGGPLVPPGTYSVRLTVAGSQLERSVEVMMDPRVTASGVSVAAVAEQTEFSLQVRDALSRARHAAEEVKQRVADAGGVSPSPRLQRIHDALITASIRYSPPMLVDQLSYLYQNLNQADQAPGHDARARHAELAAELDDLIAALNSPDAPGGRR